MVSGEMLGFISFSPTELNVKHNPVVNRALRDKAAQRRLLLS